MQPQRIGRNKCHERCTVLRSAERFDPCQQLVWHRQAATSAAKAAHRRLRPVGWQFEHRQFPGQLCQVVVLLLSKIRLAKPFDIVAELARHRQGRLDTIQSSGVERQQFLHQQVGRKSVGDDVVQLQHQPVAVVAQRIKVCLEQGAARQIERRAGMFVQRVGQFLFGVLHAGQIDMAQAGVTQRLKW